MEQGTNSDEGRPWQEISSFGKSMHDWKIGVRLRNGGDYLKRGNQGTLIDYVTHRDHRLLNNPFFHRQGVSSRPTHGLCHTQGISRETVLIRLMRNTVSRIHESTFEKISKPWVSVNYESLPRLRRVGKPKPSRSEISWKGPEND